MLRALPLSFAVALLLSGSASADGVNRIQATHTLDPGQGLHPVPTSLAKGDALIYDWRVTSPAGAALSFSTHIHLGAKIANISQDNVSAKSGRLVADRDGLYSILWINNGNDTVTYDYSYYTERIATPLPWPLAILALAVAAAARRKRL